MFTKTLHIGSYVTDSFDKVYERCDLKAKQYTYVVEASISRGRGESRCDWPSTYSKIIIMLIHNNYST